jgi:hypothetical protein
MEVGQQPDLGCADIRNLDSYALDESVMFLRVRASAPGLFREGLGVEETTCLSPLFWLYATLVCERIR